MSDTNPFGLRFVEHRYQADGPDVRREIYSTEINNHLIEHTRTVREAHGLCRRDDLVPFLQECNRGLQNIIRGSRIPGPSAIPHQPIPIASFEIDLGDMAADSGDPFIDHLETAGTD